MSGQRIKDDESYERSLKWLCEKAVQTTDPLLDSDEKAKLLRLYDIVTDELQQYRRGQMVGTFPDLRNVYKELGWPFYEPEPTSEPAPQPEPPKPKRPAWLDEDD